MNVSCCSSTIGAGLAGVGIDGDDPQHLMAALVVEERKAARVGVPAESVDAPRIGEEVVLDRDFLAASTSNKCGLSIAGSRRPA